MIALIAFTKCSPVVGFSRIPRFVECIERADSWISNDRLRVNVDKTQIIWLAILDNNLTSFQLRSCGRPRLSWLNCQLSSAR